MSYSSISNPISQRGEMLACQQCGAAVAVTAVHDAWHAQTDAQRVDTRPSLKDAFVAKLSTLGANDNA